MPKKVKNDTPKNQPRKGEPLNRNNGKTKGGYSPAKQAERQAKR